MEWLRGTPPPHSKAWICASETLAYTHSFREYLETGVAGVAMLDLSWRGGLSEAREIAALAEAWHVPVAPHDRTGPVVYAASCHFSLHARNALIQESARAFYTGWSTELVTDVPPIVQGEVTVNMKPGLGLERLPGIERRVAPSCARRAHDRGVARASGPSPSSIRASSRDLRGIPVDLPPAGWRACGENQRVRRPDAALEKRDAP